MGLTAKVVKKQLQVYSMTFKKTNPNEYPPEYRVNFIGGSEDTAYYTNDLLDAYHTGVTMAQRAWSQRNADDRGTCPQARILS